MDSAGSVNTKQGILDFLEPSSEIDVGLTSEFSDNRSKFNDVGIKEFFSRPIEIHSQLWAAADFANFHIDPWALYFNNAQVKAKLATYSLMRTTLCVKFTIDGTPFHYGRIMVGYEYSNSVAFTSADLTTCRLSQMPHIMLDPCTSKSSTMELPFIYQHEWLDLTVAAIPLGVLHFDVMNSLEMINAAAPSSVRFKVYAWCHSDMELSGPTSATLPTYVGQTEYSTGGPISRPATAIANMAAYLVDAPIIGPFARATEIGAKAVSKIAALFGYSMPRNINVVQKTVQRVIGSLHTTDGLDNCETLTSDPKRETSIDPRIAGANLGDELTFASIAGRSSYLKTVTWAPASTPHTVLATIPVTPMHYASTPGASSTVYQPTALGLVTHPFKYWTGTLEYQIQIVGASLHRGRFRIVYSPEGAAYSDLVLNTMYSTIVDISEVREVCFNVGWAQPRAFCLTQFINLSDDNHLAGTTNGLVYIVVENELSSILETQGVYINIYVKGGKDFQVRVPSTSNNVLGDIEDEIIYYNGQTDYVKETTCDMVSIPLVKGNTGRDGLDLTYFGENIQSFRSLLKTRCFWRSVGMPIATGQTAPIAKFILPAYPEGFGVGAYDKTLAEAAAAFNGFTYLNYLKPSYLGWKGSIRWKLIPTTAQFSGSSVYNIRVHLEPAESTTNLLPVLVSLTDVNAVTSSQQQLGAFRRHIYDIKGSALFLTSMGDMAEFEVPDLAPAKYHETRVVSGWDQRPGVHVAYGSGSFAVNSARVDCYAYAGEDFTLLGFKGAAPYTLYSDGYTASATYVDY